jgi:hypothetical protein
MKDKRKQKRVEEKSKPCVVLTALFSCPVLSLLNLERKCNNRSPLQRTDAGSTLHNSSPGPYREGCVRWFFCSIDPIDNDDIRSKTLLVLVFKTGFLILMCCYVACNSLSIVYHAF